MKNNPLAAVIRDAYIRNVVNRPLLCEKGEEEKNTIAHIMRYKRMVLFEQAINRFFEKCGQKTVPALSQYVAEKNLLNFALQLSGYVRDAQWALDKLTSDQAHDADLIALYQAAAKYSCACNGQIPESKYVFHEHCDYKFWKIHFSDDWETAKFNNYGFSVSPEKHNLILAMPFHIASTQKELRQWTSKFMGEALDDKSVFGSQVDVYLAHFPIEQPRGEKFALALETLRSPETFFNEADMKFALKNLSKFVGQDVEVDAQNKVVKGQAYSRDEFIQKCKNLTIVGYCAGGAHAHRWINAMNHLALQMYDLQTVRQAMKNVFILNYAFLPPQGENKYSGVHFMSNYADDNLRKEPFVKMFNPELYEQTKYQHRFFPARKSIMADKKNVVVACCLPEDVKVKDAEGREVALPNLENGHHMGVVTQRNLISEYDWSRKQFKMVLENASLGKRGNEVFCQREEFQQAKQTVFSFFCQNRNALRL